MQTMGKSLARAGAGKRPDQIEALLSQLDAGGLSLLFKREVRFAPAGSTWRHVSTRNARAEHKKRWHFDLVNKPRLWRWDLACEALKIAVEFQGGTFIRGAHSRGAGQTADNLKLVHAELDDWIVIPVDAGQVRAGVALDLIRRAVIKRQP